jgi:hypothetical protein
MQKKKEENMFKNLFIDLWIRKKSNNKFLRYFLNIRLKMLN